MISNYIMFISLKGTLLIRCNYVMTELMIAWNDNVEDNINNILPSP